MAVIRQKTIKFPGLDNVYTFADEADLFDANVPCTAGEYRIYEGDLYRCDADHTGAWNYAHFTPVKLGNEVSTAMAASVGSFAEKTIENVAIATFDDGAENVPVKSLVINVDPVQSGSGDPSPENERPISGWTGANVRDSAENLIDPSEIEFGKSYDGSATTRRCVLYKKMPCGKYTASISGLGNFSEITFGAKSQKYNRTYGPAQSLTESHKTETVEVTAEYPYLYIFAIKSTDTLPTVDDIASCGLMIVQGETAADYKAYTGTTLALTFPAEAGTVYGGTLTNQGTETWKLRVDHAYNYIDENSTLTYNGIYTDKSTEWQYVPSPAKANGQNNFISNIFNYPPVANQNVGTFGGRTNNGNVYFYLPESIGTDASAMHAWFQNHPTQLVYELATPVEYTITAEAAKTMLGLNNIWADTGDIDELIYRTMNDTDAKIRLTKALIAPVLDDMVADTLLAANDFRVVGDTLYIITGSIASGSALIPGTNCTATTIGEQITALLNA